MLNTITSGPADISMVAIKFAETFVLACVGGRGLAPGASREDKSVQRDLSPSHPFLLADNLDQAGHALARQMVGWLGSSSSSSSSSSSGGGGGGGGSGSVASGAKGGTGWGSGFGAQHYSVLINALQNLATNRAALFADIVPAFAAALESVNGGVGGGGGGRPDGRGGQRSSAAAAAAVVGAAPKGLQDAASSLRSACLRLLKVAPSATKSVQRLATAAALSGSDGEAKAAVDGNSNLRNRIKLPARVRERPKTSRPGVQIQYRLQYLVNVSRSVARRGSQSRDLPKHVCELKLLVFGCSGRCRIFIQGIKALLLRSLAIFSDNGRMLENNCGIRRACLLFYPNRCLFIARIRQASSFPINPSRRPSGPQRSKAPRTSAPLRCWPFSFPLPLALSTNIP